MDKKNTKSASIPIHQKSEEYRTVNKYGISMTHLATEDGYIEKQIKSILISAGFDGGDYKKILLGELCPKETEDGLSFATQFYFDETRLRSSVYDFAILQYNKPLVIFEYDGFLHFDENAYGQHPKNGVVTAGVRDCRCEMHVLKTQCKDADKVRIAVEHGVPCYRLNKCHLPYMRDIILLYIENARTRGNETSREINVIDTMEKYGWDFKYIPRSTPTKKEKQRIDKWLNDQK